MAIQDLLAQDFSHALDDVERRAPKPWLKQQSDFPAWVIEILGPYVRQHRPVLRKAAARSGTVKNSGDYVLSVG